MADLPPRTMQPARSLIPDGVDVLDGRAARLPPQRRPSSSAASTATSRRACSSSALDSAPRLPTSRTTPITVVPVPGAFELPLTALALAKTRRFACIVALGCIIRGETPHFDVIAGEAASGLQLAAIETGIPVSFGVLTCDTREQAEARIDRAADAARTALEMADLFSHVRTRAAQGRPVDFPAAPCRRSAPSAGRSRPSGTIEATRWWRRSGASIPTFSAFVCSSTASRRGRTSARAASAAARSRKRSDAVTARLRPGGPLV